jgi:tetratricopeptide (TPR) repeat protein
VLRQHDPRIITAIDACWAQAYVGRGSELLKSRKDDEANAQFALALAKNADAKMIDKHWADAYVGRGSELLKSRKDDEANAQFALALAKGADAKVINERWAEAYIGRGSELLEAGNQIGPALVFFNHAIEVGYGEPDTYYGRARAHEINGNTDAAIADYREAISLQDDSDYAMSVAVKARERLTALGVVVEPTK